MKHGPIPAFVALLVFSLLPPTPSASAGIKAAFLYNLSNFSGTVPYNWVRVSVDARQGETYVAEGPSVRVFNDSGMEIYAFGDDEALGVVYDVAVDGDGNILALSYKGPEYSIKRCNYRGDPLSAIGIGNLPPAFREFRPNRLAWVDGRIYLADMGRMLVAVADMGGSILSTYDLASLIGVEEKDRQETDMVGFNVDPEGGLLFSVPVHFKAYRVAPDGKVTAFGKRGSGPGKFGIVAGVAGDGKGHYVVADTLRCVVLVFDKDFRFQSEFGYRGLGPGNLVAPMDVAMDGAGRVYVTQQRRRGVSVYKLVTN